MIKLLDKDLLPSVYFEDSTNNIDNSDHSKLMEQMDVVFADCINSNMFCIALYAQNRSLNALLIRYFLLKKINFFLSKEAFDGYKNVPLFCSRIVAIRKDLVGNSDLTDIISIQKNPNFLLGLTPIKANLGAVFLSSSGTTGPPKYIYFKQEKLLKNAMNCVQKFRFKDSFKVLVPVPIGHMFGLGVGLIPSILSGARVHLVERSNIIKLLKAITEFNPDITLITPTLVKMMLKLNKELPRGVYISAGERIDSLVRGQFEEKYGLLINLYGSTELGAIATSEFLSNSQTAQEEIGALEALSGVEILIENGQEGEILCKHDFGFEYYVEQDGSIGADQEQNAEWFHTNDHGEILEKNKFRVMGRSDNCINRSGFLLSLEEIEFKLQQLFKQMNSIIVFENNVDQERLMNVLVAVCEIKKEDRPDEEEIRKICVSKLKRHMVPDEFYFVEKIEKLASGKPDRLKLVNKYKNGKNEKL